MGRSQPTVRNLIENRKEELQSYRRTLRRRHQPSFDKLFDHAYTDAPGIKAAAMTDPDIGILFAICRGQQREIDNLRERLSDD